MSQTQGCLFSSAHIELQPHCRMLLHSDRNKPETKKKKKNQTLLQKEGNNDPKTFKFSPLHFIQNVGTCNFYTLAGHAAPVLAEETMLLCLNYALREIYTVTYEATGNPSQPFF